MYRVSFWTLAHTGNRHTAVLSTLHTSLQLFNGPMIQLVEESGKEALAGKLEEFFSTVKVESHGRRSSPPQYLQTIDCTSADLLLAFNGG